MLDAYKESGKTGGSYTESFDELPPFLKEIQENLQNKHRMESGYEVLSRRFNGNGYFRSLEEYYSKPHRGGIKGLNSDWDNLRISGLDEREAVRIFEAKARGYKKGQENRRLRERNSFWNRMKDYGKKVCNWTFLSGVTAGLICSVYVGNKLADHRPMEPEPVKISAKIQKSEPLPGIYQEESKEKDFRFGGYVQNRAEEVKVPMPYGSYREGTGNNYKVILPIGDKIVMNKKGEVLVKIRHDTRPEKGVEKMGIRTKAGWSLGDPGEDFLVKITREEWDNYVNHRDLPFQAAAFKKMDGNYISFGSYTNGFMR
jgi:hypothetical protein